MFAPNLSAMKPSPSLELVDMLERVSFSLDQLERTLHSRLQDSLPQTTQEMFGLLQKHQEFERNLKSQEPELERIQARYQALSPSRRTPEVETKLSMVVEKWEQLASQSKLYMER